MVAAITTSDYVAVAEFRAGLRQYLRRSERIARQAGLTPQRYLLLLMIKGAVDGDQARLAPATRTEHGGGARPPRRRNRAARARAIAHGRSGGPSALDAR